MRFIPTICIMIFLSSIGFNPNSYAAEGQKTIRIGGEEFTFQSFRAENEDFGYFSSNSRWPSEPDGRTIVFVCWENPSSLFSKEMEWVKNAVSSSWQANSRIEFRGWQRCAAGNRGIRITINDEGPHVKALGVGLYGLSSGMVLNFTFSKWGQPCAADERTRELCIRSIGVHEFGHAIGFAHEHNRWDRAGECRERPQGTSGDVLLTPYDEHSVMNYCNLVYNNNGILSKYDIMSVQKVYGSPR